MVGTIVHQLTKNASIEEIEKAGLGAYYTDHGVDVYPQSAAGVPFNANCLACKGDPIANLQEDLAADGATMMAQHIKMNQHTIKKPIREIIFFKE